MAWEGSPGRAGCALATGFVACGAETVGPVPSCDWRKPRRWSQRRTAVGWQGSAGGEAPCDWLPGGGTGCSAVTAAVAVAVLLLLLLLWLIILCS